MRYRVYVEQVSYGHVEVEAEDFETAMELGEEIFDPFVTSTAPPVALSCEKREIREGKEVWVGA